MRWVPVCSLVLATAVGCGQSLREEDAEVECTSDLDCATGQTCVSRGLPRTQQAAPATGGVGTSGNGGVGTGGGAGVGQGGSGLSGSSSSIGGTNPGGCPVSVCPETPCAAGLICRNGGIPTCPTYLSCQVGCADPTAPACPLGTACRSNGLCETIRCDDADYPGCPTGMTCDPTVVPGVGLPGRYSVYGTNQYPYPDDRGSYATAEQTAAIAALCVFLRCDEPGAFACVEGYLCDPASAPATTTGCAGIPCGEYGRCVTDAFICEPTSMGPRPADVDSHGCVAKNCEEGRTCPNRYKCDVTLATSGDGCVPVRCDEPGEACDGYDKKCAPDAEPVTHPSGMVLGPDVYGCVYKRCDVDSYPCAGTFVCDPSNRLSDVYGCAPPSEDPPDAGVGGTAGSAGTAGAAGDPGDPGTPGVCR